MVKNSKMVFGTAVDMPHLEDILKEIGPRKAKATPPTFKGIVED